jgi:putative nucleotidyltransferase with HDIG domain
MPPKLANVPAFPAVATKLLSLLSDEGSNFSDIAACIGTDPVLSGRLIKRANAADQASYCEARTVLQAVSALGMERTRELSLAIATMGYARQAVNCDFLKPCWNHSLACALVASDLARQCGHRPAEAYTAGLLHDIGRLGLLTAYTKEYQEILSGAAAWPEDMLAHEREVFGVDHVAAGAWLAREWQLPESLTLVITRHHEPPKGELDMVALVQIACRFAEFLGYAVTEAAEPRDLDAIVAPLPQSVRARIAARIPALQEAIAAEIRQFDDPDGPAPKDSAPSRKSESPAPATASVAEETPRSRGWVMGAVLIVVVCVAVAAVALLLR